jgi:hypothetical protein
LPDGDLFTGKIYAPQAQMKSGKKEGLVEPWQVAPMAGISGQGAWLLAGWFIKRNV